MQEIKAFSGEYFFLSNSSPSPILVDGIWHPTVVHAYEAAKSKYRAVRWRIAQLPTPGAAKNAGRKIKLPPDWDERQLPIMRSLLALKFAPESELATRLLETGDQPLMEINMWHDNFWGDCHCGRGNCSEPGGNQLGKLLMERREELQKTG